MKPTKKQLERRNESFHFTFDGMKSWFYLCDGRGVDACSFHQGTGEDQQNVHGLSVTRLIDALVECGYIAKPKEHP